MGKGCCKWCNHSEGSNLTELVFCKKHRFSIHEFHEECEDFGLKKADVKEIEVPLSWEEIDQIVIALRVTNQAFKGNMRDKLEEKMNSYSMKAKEI